MPSLGDSAFIFLLALLLFGPKKLPELARQLGKLMGEFRRASNEFRMQMEEELRLSEQAERQKQIAAMEAAAPVPPALPGGSSTEELTEDPAPLPPAEASQDDLHVDSPSPEAPGDYDYRAPTEVTAAAEASETASGVVTTQAEASPAAAMEPLPIATAGDLNLMPPATGLPTPRNSSLAPLLRSVPHVDPDAVERHAETSTPASEEALNG